LREEGWLEKADELITKYRIPNAKVPQLLGNGVASGLREEGWLEKADELITKYRIPNAKVPQLLGTGVASGLREEGWLGKFDKLVLASQISNHKVPNVLCDSLASILRRDNFDHWLVAVMKAKAALSLSKDELHMMLGDGYIVRWIGHPHFLTVFEEFRKRQHFNVSQAVKQTVLRQICKEMKALHEAGDSAEEEDNSDGEAPVPESASSSSQAAPGPPSKRRRT
jgi:hypothetical protein